jgi:hypothetical protein
MKVKHLRAALEDIDGELDVTVRASDDDNDVWIVGGIRSAGIDHAHDDDDTTFFALEVTADEDEVRAAIDELESADDAERKEPKT